MQSPEVSVAGEKQAHYVNWSHLAPCWESQIAMDGISHCEKRHTDRPKKTWQQ